MPKVHFQCQDGSWKVCDAESGQNILEVALEAEVPMQHACGGYCACATCRVEVLDGQESLSKMEEEEKQMLQEEEALAPHVRLACQTGLTDKDVKVRPLLFEDF